MGIFNRREFLGMSLGGLAVAGLPSLTFGQGPTSEAWNPASVKFAPDTLFLSWQSDPTSTMTIQWVGPATNGPIDVQFATVEFPVWQTAPTMSKPYPNTEQLVYRASLSGLREGTEYQFQLASGDKLYRFRTMPQKANDAIQFVSGGDAGIDQHAINTNVIAARQEPYFALIDGDLAYDNGKSPDTFTQFLRNYSRTMVDPKGRLVPIIAGIGNHEVKGGYKGTRADAPQFLSVFDGFFSEKTFGVLDIGDYLSLVLLDTGHIAPIAGEQTDWLAGTLAERVERPHLIVANHVPAYPSYRAPEGDESKPGTGAEQRKLWCPLFERYQVDLVLEHHDHTFKRTHPLVNGLKDRHGVLYLGDGSWGKLRIPKTPEDRPYLAAVSASYHMTVHRLEGKRRFHVALDEFGRVAEACTTKSKRPARRG